MWGWYNYRLVKNAFSISPARYALSWMSGCVGGWFVPLWMGEWMIGWNDISWMHDLMALSMKECVIRSIGRWVSVRLLYQLCWTGKYEEGNETEFVWRQKLSPFYIRKWSLDYRESESKMYHASRAAEMRFLNPAEQWLCLHILRVASEGYNFWIYLRTAVEFSASAKKRKWSIWIWVRISGGTEDCRWLCADHMHEEEWNKSILGKLHKEKTFWLWSAPILTGGTEDCLWLCADHIHEEEWNKSVLGKLYKEKTFWLWSAPILTGGTEETD